MSRNARRVSPKTVSRVINGEDWHVNRKSARRCSGWSPSWITAAPNAFACSLVQPAVPSDRAVHRRSGLGYAADAVSRRRRRAAGNAAIIWWWELVDLGQRGWQDHVRSSIDSCASGRRHHRPPPICDEGAPDRHFPARGRAPRPVAPSSEPTGSGAVKMDDRGRGRGDDGLSDQPGHRSIAGFLQGRWSTEPPPGAKRGSARPWRGPVRASRTTWSCAAISTFVPAWNWGTGADTA